MRYFVYYQPETSDVRPHILAEVVRDSFDDGRYREWSAAATIAGERCEVLTREELMHRPDGARALLAWERVDDWQFDIDTRRILESIEREEARASETGRHLRLVPDATVASDFVVADRRLQVLEARRRQLTAETARLRSRAQELVAAALARRQARPSPDGSAAAEDTGSR